MSGEKRTGVPPKEWAKHLRPFGKNQFWSTVRTKLRSRPIEKKIALDELDAEVDELIDGIHKKIVDAQQRSKSDKHPIEVNVDVSPEKYIRHTYKQEGIEEIVAGVASVQFGFNAPPDVKTEIKDGQVLIHVLARK